MAERVVSSYTNFHVDLDNKNSSWTLVYDFINPGAKILDVGCSSGYFDEVLIKQKDCTVDGVEIDDADAELARDICRKVVVGNIEDHDFPWTKLDGHYDYILFIDVLEHLVNPATCLRRVSELLSKNGKIIFSIPNMANAAVRLQLLQGNFDYEKDGLLDATHLHYYTAKTIDHMILSSGLVCEDVKYVSFDVIRDTVDSILGSVGLNNTDKFQKFMTSRDAVVYQYVGMLSRNGDGRRIEIQPTSKAIKPHKYYEDQLATVQEDARKTFVAMENSNKEVEVYRELATKLREANDSLCLSLDTEKQIVSQLKLELEAVRTKDATSRIKRPSDIFKKRA